MSTESWELHLQVEAATSLLTDRRWTLAQIASQVGCADQSHLTRILRSDLGLPPGRFRKLLPE